MLMLPFLSLPHTTALAVSFGKRTFFVSIGLREAAHFSAETIAWISERADCVCLRSAVGFAVCQMSRTTAAAAAEGTLISSQQYCLTVTC